MAPQLVGQLLLPAVQAWQAPFTQTWAVPQPAFEVHWTVQPVELVQL